MTSEPHPYCKPHASHFCPCCKPELYVEQPGWNAEQRKKNREQIEGWRDIAPIVPIAEQGSSPAPAARAWCADCNGTGVQPDFSACPTCEGSGYAPARSRAGEDHTGMSQSSGQGETSREAAEWISSLTGKMRLQVLWAIRNSPRGLTDEEGYTLLGMAANTWRPRRVELHDGWKDLPGGFVRDSGRKRKTRAGRPAIVWVATEKGLNT